MSLRQWVAEALRRSPGAAAIAVLALPSLVVASNHIVVTGGSPQPIGDTADFNDAGSSFDVRWRHYNRGRTAYEFSIGYLNNGISGVIPQTIDEFEALIRDKNLRAQADSQPGEGTVEAEFGTLEVYSFNVNVMYRFSRRARFSPVVSVGAGVYNWRVPFRVSFRNVPSFGEQRPYHPPESEDVVFVFDDRFPPQEIDYTKHETSGGLNAALGANLGITRNIGIDFEARAHLIFSSGEGDPELAIDNQDYLSPLNFLIIHGGLSYRF